SVPPSRSLRVLSSTSVHGSRDTRLPGVSSYFGGLVTSTLITASMNLPASSHGSLGRSWGPRIRVIPRSGSRPVTGVSEHPVLDRLSVTTRPLSCLFDCFGASIRESLRSIDRLMFLVPLTSLTDSPHAE